MKTKSVWKDGLPQAQGRFDCEFAMNDGTKHIEEGCVVIFELSEVWLHRVRILKNGVTIAPNKIVRHRYVGPRFVGSE